jgi:hypothetical protein
MPRYRIEIKQGASTRVVEVECEGIENIRVEAMKLAQAYINDLPTDFWEAPLWALRVTDESNMSILTLTLSGD